MHWASLCGIAFVGQSEEQSDGSEDAQDSNDERKTMKQGEVRLRSMHRRKERQRESIVYRTKQILTRCRVVPGASCWITSAMGSGTA